MTRSLYALLTVFWILWAASAGALAQQPQTYIQGTGTTGASDLHASGVGTSTLTIAAGSVLCNGTLSTLSSSTTVTFSNGVNYVYIDQASGCGSPPTFIASTAETSFHNNQIPIAVVEAVSGTITSIVDARPWSAVRAGPTVFATDFPGADIGQQINNAYAALPAGGGRIMVPPNPSGCYSFSTPINLSTSGSDAIIEGAGIDATCLRFIPTLNTAVTFNGGFGQLSSGLRHLQLQGPGSYSLSGGRWTFSGSTGTCVSFGGSAAYGGVLEDVQVSGFGTGVSWGTNAFFQHIQNSRLVNNGMQLTLPDSASGSGLTIAISHTLFGITNPSYYVPDTVEFDLNASEVHIEDCEFDGTGLLVKDGEVVCDRCHFEDVQATHSSWFIHLTGGQLHLSNSFVLAGYNATSPELINMEGGVLVSHGGSFWSSSTLASLTLLAGTANAYFWQPAVVYGFTTPFSYSGWTGKVTWTDLATNALRFYKASGGSGAVNTQLAGDGSSVSYLNASGGNVGIGTASPQGLLHVNGSAVISNNNALQWLDSGSSLRNTMYLDNAATNVLHIRNNQAGTGGPITFETTAAAERMRVDTGGYVGIGTNQPSSVLHVQTNLNPLPSLTYHSASYLSLDSPNNGELAFGWDPTSNKWEWWLQGRNASGVAQNISLDPLGGNVGIGTTSPSAVLHIQTNLNPSPSLTYHSPSDFSVDSPGNGELAAGWQPSSPYSWWFQGRNASNSAQNILFDPLGGSVGIGTTNPSSHLQLQVAGAMGAGLINQTSLGATPQFDASAGNTQEGTLNTNASSSMINPVQGEWLNFIICQPSSGGYYSYTFAWPSHFPGAPAVSPGLGVCTIHPTVWDGTNAVPLGRDSTGALIATSIVANGTNQGITLTPSGTGAVNLPASVNIGSSSQLMVSAGGAVTKYNGISTSNNGVPAEVASVTDGPKSTGGSTVTILASTSASDSFYLIDLYAEETTAGSGMPCSTNASIPLNLRWTGPASQTQNSTPVTLTLTPALAGNNAVQTVVVRAKASTALTLVEGTFTNGNCTTQPKYSVWSTATAM